jgi:hypothetical protein
MQLPIVDCAVGIATCDWYGNLLERYKPPKGELKLEIKPF